MQADTQPVIPVTPVSRLTADVGQDFGPGIIWAPELVCACNAVVEHYLVGLLQDAHLISIERWRSIDESHSDEAQCSPSIPDTCGWPAASLASRFDRQRTVPPCRQEQ